MTVEKLIGADIPKRVQYLRVIIMELARISDHLICNTVIAVDTGALTGFVYLFQFRELIYEIYEEICGARLTTNIGRIGGFVVQPPQLRLGANSSEWIRRSGLCDATRSIVADLRHLKDERELHLARRASVGPAEQDRPGHR